MSKRFEIRANLPIPKKVKDNCLFSGSSLLGETNSLQTSCDELLLDENFNIYEVWVEKEIRQTPSLKKKEQGEYKNVYWLEDEELCEETQRNQIKTTFVGKFKFFVLIKTLENNYWRVDYVARLQDGRMEDIKSTKVTLLKADIRAAKSKWSWKYWLFLLLKLVYGVLQQTKFLYWKIKYKNEKE